jgi:hypothetical protein
MIEKFMGDQYLFELEISPRGKKFDFHLFAIDRQSFHYSNINDLTTILSWLGIQDGNPLVEDKCWIISRSRMYEFRRSIHRLLTSQDSLKYLESCLNEDRGCGEWANRLQVDS